MSPLALAPHWSGMHKLRGSSRRCLAATLDLLFPPVCAACSADLSSDRQDADTSPAAALLCQSCREQMVDLQRACPKCAETLGAGTPDQPDCPRCRQRGLRFQAVVRLGQYRGLLRSSVLRTKQPSGHPISVALARLLVKCRGDQLQALAIDCVVPIPMHWSRRVWRGVNNPDLLADHVARRLGVPVAAHLLKRVRHTHAQASLSPGQRFENVRGAFRALPHRDLAGARVLLVDDIMTTGATASEAAKVLRKAGAAHVSVVVLARAEALL